MENTHKSFLFHLILLLLVCAALYVISFFVLHLFTKHGEEVTLPGITGWNATLAIAELERGNFTVAVDSSYQPGIPPRTVLRQVPDSGSIVKEGRMVFITVNMVNPPLVHMPNLVGLSLPNAQIQLASSKLCLGDTVYKPHIRYGEVLEQLYNGFPIRPGVMVSQASKISLQIGDGLGNTEHTMQDVTGIPVDMAQTILSQYSLEIAITAKNGATITDTAKATVLEQLPPPGTHIKDGDRITLIVQ